MLVERQRSSRRPASMVLSDFGHLRTHTDLEKTQTQKKEVSPGTNEAGDDPCTLKKGVIWYSKDTFLSRWNWKERYFILTKDYLSCFKKAKSQYSDMGAFLFQLPLASLSGVEWDRSRGCATVAISDSKEGRLLIRSTQDVLDQWYKAVKKAMEASKARRRCLRQSSSTLSRLGSSSLSGSSPAIDRLCERVEREVWGEGRLMRRQRSELDTAMILRRRLLNASQKRHNRQSLMPDMDIYDAKQNENENSEFTLRYGDKRRHNDSLDSTGHSASTTPSKSSMSSTEGGEAVLRRAAADGAAVVLRSSSVRRRGRGRTPAGVHGDQIRPHSILCDSPSDPSEVVLRRRQRAAQPGEAGRAESRRSCDLSLLKRRSAYLTRYED